MSKKNEQNHMREDEKDEKEKKLSSMFSNLPSEIDPPDFIWDRIENSIDLMEEADRLDETIEEEVQGQNEIRVHFLTGLFTKHPYAGAAVAALVMVVLTFGLFTRFYNPEPEMVSVENQQYEEALKQLEEAAFEYNNAREDLLVLIDNNEALLADETIAAIKENVILIDSAVNDIKTALQQDPNNQQILVQLATIYYEETNMLLKTNDLLEGITN